MMFKSTTFHRRLLTLFVILIAWKVKSVQLVSYQSHLCEAMDMPCELGNGDECRMKYYKLNSTECRDLAFGNNAKISENELGKLKFTSYHFQKLSYKQTGFNLTFSNISWYHLKFRFKQEGNELKNTCREFYMSANSSIKNLFYDCLWSNEAYEGKTFSLEYQATNETLTDYKKYSFRVPFAKNIDETTELKDWELFIYVEMIKNAMGLTTFILHWQPVPEKFLITTYNVSVMSNETGQSEIIHSENVICNDEEDCKYYYNKWYGNVQFGIQPVCKNGSECFVSKTVVFLLGGENTKPLLIGIASVSLIIAAVLYVLFLLRNYFIKKSKKWISPVPKLLIIFTPSIASHVNVVFALVEYLKLYCNVEPMVDELHIFYSESRHPFVWCNEAFKTADFVMVVTSPYHQHLRLADTVYQKTDALLLRFLRERLASRDSKTRFFVLMLPYCSEKDIPREAIHLRRFSFPQDLNKMLRFIHRDKSLVDCLNSNSEIGKESYKLFGTKLSNAIAETQINLKKNESEYDRMIEEMRNEKIIGSEQSLIRDSRVSESPKVFRSMQKRRWVELSEEMFSEFPGRLSDLDLSGKEEESLMGSQVASDEITE